MIRRQRELERILSCLMWLSMWTSRGLWTWWAKSMGVWPWRGQRCTLGWGYWLILPSRYENATVSGSQTHTEVFRINAGAGLQQDVGSIHISCQHSAVQRRVPVHFVHGAQRGVVFNQESCRFWAGEIKGGLDTDVNRWIFFYLDWGNKNCWLIKCLSLILCLYSPNNLLRCQHHRRLSVSVRLIHVLQTQQREKRKITLNPQRQPECWGQRGRNV